MRSMSGTGLVRALPNTRPDEISLGRWSTVDAEYTWGEPRAFSRTRLYRSAPRLWAFGLPTYAARLPRPWVVDHPTEALGHRVPRLGPRHRLEAAVALDQRLAQPIRVVVELLERGALRAQVAVAEHVEHGRRGSG